MKKGILLFIHAFGMTYLGLGQIAAWDFTGVGSTSLPTYAATTFNSNLVSTSGANNITRGATAAWSTGGNSFRTTGFKNEGISTSNSDYFQITLTAATGYTLSLSTIDARFAGTASFCISPGVSSQFAYSLDGSTFTLIGSSQATIGTPATMTQIDLTGVTSLQNVAAGTTITLRYYASGQTATGGWGFYSASAGTNGLAIGGDVYNTSTFTGTGNWNLAGNWSNGIPTSSINAIIDGVATIDIAAQTRDLTINTGKSVTISVTKSLIVHGTTILNSTDCLILKSDATGTASFIDNGFAGTGTVKVERYLSQNAWHYTCFPVTTTQTNPLQGLYVMYYSEPLHHFRYITGLDSTLNQSMLGYGIWSGGSNSTVNFSGTLNSGSLNIPVSRTYQGPGVTNYDGWNLVGNPYPSALDLVAITGGWTNVEATAYFWNGSVYLAYPTMGGYGTHSQYAPAMQGFFVHCNDASATPSTPGSGTVTVNNAARVHNSTGFLKSTTAIMNGLIITASGYANNYTDKISVHFNPNATSGYDPGYDAYKLWGLNEAPQIYMKIADTNVTCNSLPFASKTMVIPMGFSCGLPGQYTLTADSLGTFQNNIEISLEDLKLNKTRDLRLNREYTFNYDTLDNPNRFVLHFDNPSLGVEEIKIDNRLQIYSFGSFVYIKSTDGMVLSGDVFISDMIGRELYRGHLVSNTLNRITPVIDEGYYVVKVITNDGVYSGKIYLEN
jgi:hypothetical protein